MGACFSEPLLPSAKVVSVNGDLRLYNVPVLASQVLQSETFSSSSSSSFFLCNSDRLYYDDYIPALDSQDELQPNQIYFVFPTSKLQYRLSASDMAALAVKASVALQKASKKGGLKRRKTQISPVFEVVNPRVSNEEVIGLKKMSYGKSNPLGISRSGSFRKVQRYTSRRAKMAVRSFRLRLSTIYEGTVL